MRSQAKTADSVALAGRLWTTALLGGLLVLINGYPHWVGVWVGRGSDWRFLPLLAPGYSAHLDSLDIWLGLALALNVVLLRRRQWDRTSRWLQFVVGAVGALTLYQMATGPELLGLQNEWLDLHRWPPELREDPRRLVQSFSPLFRLSLFVGFGGLVALSIRRLLQLLDLADPARKLVREGLGDRGFAGTVELLRQDTGRAFAVIDRDQVFGPTPDRPLPRFIHQAKVVLRGIAVQLTPTRRLLFAVSMVLAIPDKTRWAAVAGLFLLLLLELVDRIRVRDELELARELQRDLLPSSVPVMPGWTVAHSYRTANAIGGDYYDFQRTAAGRVALVIGDASGHGMAAALIMAIANATLKAAIDHEPAPAQVIARVNHALFRTGGRRAFMTLFYGLLDLDDGRFDYLCAGHPFPLLRRAAGEIVELGAGCLPLGIRETLKVESRQVVIEPGDRLLLYSDGLPEALDGPEGEAFGYRRLTELLADAGTPQEIHDRIWTAFDLHVGQNPLADDLTLAVLHRLPEKK